MIDQFEELFTLVDGEDERQRFVAAQVRAVNTPGSRVRVVITMRADLYDRPLRYGGLAELLRTRTEVIVPLTVEELERAVRAPAERVGVEVEADLLSHIVADVTDQPGALPLLQYALTLLFERRRSGALSRASYDEIGGVAGALARHAEEVFAALPDAGREAARQLFLRSVNLGETGEETGRRASRTELDSLEADRDELVSAIETFGPARLCCRTLVASGLSVFGFAQWDRAHPEASIATVRELAASAAANLEVDPELSILLPLEAVERSRAAEDAALPEAEEALHRAVGQSRIVLNVPDVGGSLDWSSGGTCSSRRGRRTRE